MEKQYYLFYMEIALKDSPDSNIYAFENVSHVHTKKLIEIFGIDVVKDPDLLEGYFLTEELYNKHKEFIDENIGAINLDVFEYCLRYYVAADFKEIRKLYKENLME
jgi:predicted transcriptional regulator